MRRWAARAAVALVLLAVTLLVAIHVGPGRRLVAGQVFAQLRALGIGVTAGDVRYNVLTLSLALDDAAVRSLRTPALPVFATVRHARLTLSIRHLIRGRYVVDSATVEGLAVHYVVAADGTTNLPAPPPRDDLDEPVETIDYLVQDTTLTDARVRFEDRVTGVDVALPVSRVRIDGTFATRHHDVDITAGGGTARVGERRADLEALEARLDLGRDDVALSRLSLTAAGVQIDASGRIDGFEAPSLDLTARVDADLARALAAAAVGEPVGGRLTVDLAATGPVDAVVVRATATGEALAARGLPAAALDFHGRYDRAAALVTVERLRTTASWGHASAEGRIALDGGATHVAARLDGFDAAAVSTALALPTQVATRVSGDATLDMPGLDYTAASGTARLAMAATARRPRADVLPVSGTIRGIASGPTATLVLDHLDVMSTRVAGTLTLRDRTAVTGTLRAGARDVGQVLRAVEAWLGEPSGTLLPTPVGGGVSLRVDLGGSITAPRARAALDAPSLAIGTLRHVRLAAVAAATRDAMVIPDLRVDWADAAIAAAGRVALTGRREVEARASVDALPVETVLAALDMLDTPVSGVLRVSARVTGPLDRIDGRATLQATDLVAYAEPLGSLAVDARLSAGAAVVDSAVLVKPQQNGEGRLEASGRYALSDGAYEFALRTGNVRLESLTLSDGMTARGDVAISADGRGTAATPAGRLGVASEGLVVDGREVGPLTATVVLADGSASFDAAVERFGSRVNGAIAINAPYGGRADLTIDDLDLAALPLQIATPLSGRLRAHVHAEGAASAPADASVAATVEQLDARWNDQPVALAAPATLTLSDRILRVDALRLDARDSTATVSGAVPLDAEAPPGQVDLDARLQLATLARYAPRGTDVSAEGTLRVRGRVTGTARAVVPDVAFDLTDGQLSAPGLGSPVTGVQLSAEVAGGLARISRVAAEWAGARLEASAQVPLAFAGPLPVDVPATSQAAELQARVTGFDPGAVPGAPAGLTGRIAFEATATAASMDPAGLEGRLAFDTLEVGYRDLTLAQQAPASIVARDGVATVERLALSGSAGSLAVSGDVTLTGETAVDLTSDGSLELAALSFLTDAARVSGPVTFQVAARGPVQRPSMQGHAELTGGTVVIDDPADIAIEQLRARLDLTGSQVRLSALSGTVNGGRLSGSGTVGLDATPIPDADLRLEIDELSFSAPLDLRSTSDVALALRTRDDQYVVSGDVRIAEGGLTGDINFDTGVLGLIGRPRELDLTAERNPQLERVRFDVHVVTDTPILVDNNMATAELTTDVHVLGTPYDTGMSGRLELLDGSSVTLNERRYDVERGVITFTDERVISPSFDLRLTTNARHYDVTLGVTGDVGATETTLTSNPSLPEPDIMALLVTGRTLDDMRGEEYDVAREQVLSYLTGRVGSSLGRGLEQATGLSEVRVEPTLIAAEADPGARLTVGQELTDGLRLVYSTDLTDSSNQIWMAEYDITRRFETRAVRQRDNTYRAEFRHDLRFGGTPEPRRQPRVRPLVTAVDLRVDGGAAAPALVEAFAVEAGDAYDFFTVREGLDRIERRLRDDGYLQARARSPRPAAASAAGADGVALTVSVTRGPRVRLDFQGAVPPTSVRRELARQWQRGVVDRQRQSDAADVLRAWLMGDRYLNPRIDVTIEDTADARTVHLSVDAGPRFDAVRLVFEGAHGIPPDELIDIVHDQDLEEDLFTDPTVVTELLRRVYREEGYLAASLAPPERQFDGTTARVVIRVDEGPRFVVGRLAPVGHAAVSADTLLAEAPLRVGDTFLPAVAERSLDRMRRLYWQRGYNDVRLQYSVEADRLTGEAGVAIEIDEGARSLVQDIAVSGTERTDTPLVTAQLEVAPDDVLDVAALGRARRSLYATGAYSLVEVERTPVSPAPPTSANPTRTPAAGDLPVDVHVRVREVQPFQLGYGVSFDTERGLGGVFEFTNTNSLGHARQAGVSTRYDSQLRQVRAYVSQPFLASFPLQTTAAVYLRQERSPSADVSRVVDLDRTGASLQQERRFAGHYVWNYGVRWERAHTLDQGADRVLERRTIVAPFTSTLTRETRDDVLDASRGSFVSQAFSYAPRWFGADAAYLRYYGQFFTYVPLRPPTRERLTNDILRPRLVWASGVRLGLARGLGGAVPFGERFFGGGSTSVRGFAQNTLGPRDVNGAAAGGAATLVVNSELRVPVVSIVDGVGFFDVGGVSARISDWRWSDLRASAGLGVRVRTPWFLLRGDYGLVLDRRRGEPRGRLFFGIGQAF